MIKYSLLNKRYCYYFIFYYGMWYMLFNDSDKYSILRINV